MQCCKCDNDFRNSEHFANIYVLHIPRAVPKEIYIFFGFVLFLVQYALHLYGYFKEWRKNPHCSFTCCLALFLPLVDLQGEIHGMVEKNVMITPLQTGNFETTTLRGAVKDSGALEVTLEEREQGDALNLQDDNRQVTKISNKKCHQGTQTEFSSLVTVADFPVQETHL